MDWFHWVYLVKRKVVGIHESDSHHELEPVQSNWSYNTKIGIDYCTAKHTQKPCVVGLNPCVCCSLCLPFVAFSHVSIAHLEKLSQAILIEAPARRIRPWGYRKIPGELCWVSWQGNPRGSLNHGSGPRSDKSWVQTCFKPGEMWLETETFYNEIERLYQSGVLHPILMIGNG